MPIGKCEHKGCEEGQIVEYGLASHDKMYAIFYCDEHYEGFEKMKDKLFEKMEGNKKGDSDNA